MSTSTHQGRARASLSSLPLPRPRLTVVPKVARPARSMPFAVLVIAVLATGLVGLLLLNTSMERGAYQVTALRSQASALSAQQQTLQLQVAALQDPQEVAQKALQLGMVQNTSPAFLSLATGQVIGKSVPAVRGNQFDIGTKIGPRVDRLGKIAPIVGGEANGAGTHLVRRPAATTTTKGGDTRTGSRGSKH
jgi:hypothetical protein